MIQPAFDISRDDLVCNDDCRLLVEVSSQALNYILYSRSPDQLFLLRQYRMYTTADTYICDIIEEIISEDPILRQYADRATIVYNFPEATLFPAGTTDAGLNVPVMTLMHGHSDQRLVFNEVASEESIQTIYSVPKDVHSLLQGKFPGGAYWHLYSMLLRWEGKLDGDVARIVFYHDKFIAAIYRSAELQLVQSFSYQTAEDAAYYLLLIARQFGMKPDQMSLQVCGLIDSQSPLYSELLKYFVRVEYEDVPASYGTNGLLADYPSHYFSPLLKISLCV